ncbi:hypothetical protein D1007_25202 [Hordeum vulgare]|nr:hypothetical protein D1007_25202 [Hordeum vulgare]
MGKQSKRTRAPAPHLIPSAAPHLLPLQAPHLIPPPPQPVSPPLQGFWIPPRPEGPLWAEPARLARPQGPLWAEPSDSNSQAWGVDSYPPDGFLSLLKNTSSLAQDVSNGSSSLPINDEDATNGGDCARIVKRLPWTKEEDLILEANALYASGESDEDLMERAMKTYEADHKEDGPFMLKHCWDVLKKQPKWDAYLERLEDLEPEKRKFNVNDDVGNQFTLDDVEDERPMGGKKAKAEPKRKRKEEAFIIDLEDELNKL